MCILPIEASLKDAVEFGKGDLSWNHNLSPNIHPVTGQLNSENKGFCAFIAVLGGTSDEKEDDPSSLY